LKTKSRMISIRRRIGSRLCSRAMIGFDLQSIFLSVDWLLSQFGQDKKQAVSSFRKFVKKGIGGDFPEEALQAGLILGSEKFVTAMQDRVEARIGQKEIPRLQRYASEEPLDKIFCKGERSQIERDELIYLSYVSHGYTMKEIADYLGKHDVSISRAVRCYEEKTKK
jgi:putative transposase